MRILTLLCLLATTVWAEDADTTPKKVSFNMNQVNTRANRSPFCNQPPFAPPSKPAADVYFFEAFNSEEDYEKQYVTVLH